MTDAERFRRTMMRVDEEAAAVYVAGRLRALAGTTRYVIEEDMRTELLNLSAMFYEPATLNVPDSATTGRQE